MKFFCDNCISSKLSKSLHILSHPEHEVVHLSDRFAPNTPDTEWITTLANEGNWIIISGDTKISKRPAEREIWKKSKLTTFFFARGFATHGKWDQVSWAMSKWPQILEMSTKVTAGSVFEVPKVGKKLRPF